jgi:D-alanyl-D-alanine dipeptidase
MSETFCPHCGGIHDPGTGSCPELPLAGRTFPDGFRVLEKRLGEDALGEVYLAEDRDSHVEVDLVFLRSEVGGSEPDPRALARSHLRDRLHNASRIQHPNIAGVRAVGETEEGRWFAVEVLRGKLLSEILSERNVLPLNEAIDLVLQAASGLQAAHQAGLVHGNLSPDTILVTRTPENRPLVKLLGFGSVRYGAKPSVGGGGREAHAWSPKYAAPERLVGHSADERSDVFSLGAMLQHLLTGTPRVVWDDAQRIPEATRRVLAKALESPPDDRFQTVAAFARALTTATSRPPARIWSGARRGVRLGRVVAVAVVVAVATLWLWGSRERFKVGDAGYGGRGAGDPIATGEVRERPSAASPVRRGSASPRPDDTTASGSMLVDVRSVDSTIQVDLRYATANNFTGAPLPGYEAARALLRREAAVALGRVQAELRSKGLGLRVFDAYRPVRASLAMMDWAERTGQKALLESGYLAGRSRHNLGAAVDLTLVDLKTGTEVPMGSTFDNFTSTGARMSNASGEAARNRQILVQAMQSEGFSPYDQAWWHFNYPIKGAVPLDRVIR